MASEARGVQLEDGYVRIANAVMEALALASFNQSQLRLLLFVIRMTWGWRRPEARLSYPDITAGTGLARSTASDAVRSLVSAGVLIMVQSPTFRDPGTYRLQKDPRLWGPYALTPPALESTGNSESAGSPESTEESESTDAPDRRVPGIRSQSTENPESPDLQAVGREPVTAAERHKLKDSSKNSNNKLLRARGEDVERIVQAANRGMAQNPATKDSFNPLLVGHGGTNSVEEWLDSGIPPDLIVDVVFEAAKTWKRDGRYKQIISMAYFDNRVVDAYGRKVAASGNEQRVGETDGGRGAVGASGKKSKFGHLVEGGRDGAAVA